MHLRDWLAKWKAEQAKHEANRRLESPAETQLPATSNHQLPAKPSTQKQTRKRRSYSIAKIEDLGDV